MKGRSYHQRRREAALGRALALQPHRRNSYEHELVRQHEEKDREET